MPNLPWNRPATELTCEQRSFEALLAGAALPADAPADTYLVADVVTALRGPATADELAGFLTASGTYRKRFVNSPQHGQPVPWRPAMLGSRLSAKLALALAAGVVALGGAGAAAYAGALPDAAQNVAHALIGAPAGHHHSHGSGSRDDKHGTATPGPVGPDATGPAAFGLCNAYAHAKIQGDSVGTSVAFKNLAAAAGGAANIDAYCAKVPHPGSSHSDHAKGKPSTLPSHPAGKPSTLPPHPAGTRH